MNMYKVGIKTLTEIKNSLIKTNDILKENLDSENQSMPSSRISLEEQIKKNEEMISILESVYLI